MSCGYIQGYTDSDEIKYCPACGSDIDTCYSDGTVECYDCGRNFGVIFKDDSGSEDEDENSN